MSRQLMILLAFLCAQATAEEAKISGHLTDWSSRQPIEAINITATVNDSENESSPYFCPSGLDTGEYSIEVPAGEYVVTGDEMGFWFTKETVTVRDGDKVVVNVECGTSDPASLIAWQTNTIRQFDNVRIGGMAAWSRLSHLAVRPEIKADVARQLAIENPGVLEVAQFEAYSKAPTEAVRLVSSLFEEALRTQNAVSIESDYSLSGIVAADILVGIANTTQFEDSGRNVYEAARERWGDAFTGEILARQAVEKARRSRWNTQFNDRGLITLEFQGSSGVIRSSDERAGDLSDLYYITNTPNRILVLGNVSGAGEPLQSKGPGWIRLQLRLNPNDNSTLTGSFGEGVEFGGNRIGGVEGEMAN